MTTACSGDDALRSSYRLSAFLWASITAGMDDFTAAAVTLEAELALVQHGASALDLETFATTRKIAATMRKAKP